MKGWMKNLSVYSSKYCNTYKFEQMIFESVLYNQSVDPVHKTGLSCFKFRFVKFSMTLYHSRVWDW